jgi:hypothetical protein
MKILFTRPQGIHYFDTFIKSSGYTGILDRFPMPMVYFGQAFDHSGRHPVCRYIKAGKATGPHSRIRAYNQSGIDFRIWALYIAPNYAAAARVEDRLRTQYADHRVRVPGRGQRELYDFRVADLGSIIDSVTEPDRVIASVISSISAVDPVITKG